ncbi:hypothetical protein [Roseibium sp.]|uniref:hypothetical protein n=1 Tax=Roseibium sp. TaxID=1936156 RepID=UPI001B15A02B|nr:hypothetical protein [Roseibium sp.]MBO6858493.1 hypothetical protein [Roseibium sp.]
MLPDLLLSAVAGKSCFDAVIPAGAPGQLGVCSAERVVSPDQRHVQRLAFPNPGAFPAPAVGRIVRQLLGGLDLPGLFRG